MTRCAKRGVTQHLFETKEARRAQMDRSRSPSFRVFVQPFFNRRRPIASSAECPTALNFFFLLLDLAGERHRIK